MPHPPLLALDIGGTKIAAARVRGREIVERREIPTPARDGPEAVARAAADLLTAWRPHTQHLAVAATGHVRDGHVTAMNTGTLAHWGTYPLADRLAELTGARIALLNDAHAAAWGEYRYGAGRGTRDFLFLTISTGIGSGIVLNGRLVTGATGLAGHIGFWRDTDPANAAAPYLEAHASGRAISERLSHALGSPTSTREAFALADRAHPEATRLVEDALHRTATTLLNLRLLIDPEHVAIGGGVGLANGYLERLDHLTRSIDPAHAPALVPAELGGDAGLIGAAAWREAHA